MPRVFSVTRYAGAALHLKRDEIIAL